MKKQKPDCCWHYLLSCFRPRASCLFLFFSSFLVPTRTRERIWFSPSSNLSTLHLLWYEGEVGLRLICTLSNVRSERIGPWAAKLKQTRRAAHRCFINLILAPNPTLLILLMTFTKSLFVWVLQTVPLYWKFLTTAHQCIHQCSISDISSTCWGPERWHSSVFSVPGFPLPNPTRAEPAPDPVSVPRRWQLH